MIVGLLFVSLLASTLTTSVGLGLGMSPWAVLVIFPMTGSLTLVLLSALVYRFKSKLARKKDLAEHDIDPVLA